MTYNVTRGEVRGSNGRTYLYHIADIVDGNIDVLRLPSGPLVQNIQVKIQKMKNVTNVIPYDYGLRVTTRSQSDWTPRMDARIQKLMRPFITHPTWRGRLQFEPRILLQPDGSVDCQ